MSEWSEGKESPERIANSDADELASDAVMDNDEDGGAERMNSSLRDMYGIEKAAAIGSMPEPA